MITTAVMTKNKRPAHYVNNKEFLDALVQYKLDCKKAAENNEKRPQIPRYIGECFLHIATRFGYQGNYANYSFKEDLISDAVENMSRYILNFDPEKSTNPFAYFTQITYYAYLRRIKIEKRESEKKSMIIERLNFSEVMSDNGECTDNYSDYSSIRDNVYLRNRIQ
jgi:hypothetical protein